MKLTTEKPRPNSPVRRDARSSRRCGPYLLPPHHQSQIPLHPISKLNAPLLRHRNHRPPEKLRDRSGKEMATDRPAGLVVIRQRRHPAKPEQFHHLPDGFFHPHGHCPDPWHHDRAGPGRGHIALQSPPAVQCRCHEGNKDHRP